MNMNVIWKGYIGKENKGYKRQREKILEDLTLYSMPSPLF